MNKQDFLEVLAHQTQGIMLHTDLVALFWLLKMKKCWKFQVNQLHEEMNSYLETSNLYVDTFKDLPELDNIKKIQIEQETIISPATESERQEWYEKAVNIWVDWEKDTLELYTKMMDNDIEHLKFWKCKVKKVRCELDRARKLQMKFTYTKIPTVETAVVLLNKNNEV